MKNAQNQPSITLDERQRELVRQAVVETCDNRKYTLYAVNVRSNHAHSVISKAIKPEKIVDDLKVRSTRKLRENWEFGSSERVWSHGASVRYLWKPRHLAGAIDHVLYCQENVPFEFRDRVYEVAMSPTHTDAKLSGIIALAYARAGASILDQ